MIEEIFLEIGISVIAVLLIGIWVTVYEIRKHVIEERGKKK